MDSSKKLNVSLKTHHRNLASKRPLHHEFPSPNAPTPVNPSLHLPPTRLAIMPVSLRPGQQNKHLPHVLNPPLNHVGNPCAKGTVWKLCFYLHGRDKRM